MSISRFSPQALYDVLLNTEMDRYKSFRFGEPIVFGKITKVDEIIDTSAQSSASSAASNIDSRYAYKPPFPFIDLESPCLLSDYYNRLREDSAFRGAEMFRKNDFTLLFPISSDPRNLFNLALVGCAEQSKPPNNSFPPSIRAFEISPSRIRINNSETFGPNINDLAHQVSLSMGVNKTEIENINLEFRKFLLLREGDYFHSNGVSPIHNSAYGFLMIQLPTTDYAGGNIIATQNNKRIEVNISSDKETLYLAWLKDLSWEMKPIESGLRVVMVIELYLENMEQKENNVAIDVDSNREPFPTLKSLAILNETAYVKAFKKMVETQSFLYPILCGHGFDLSKPYKPRHFYKSVSWLHQRDQNMINFIKMVANEAYGGPDYYEIGIFEYSQNEHWYSTESVKFSYCTIINEFGNSHGKDTFLVQNPNWLAQRVYDTPFDNTIDGNANYDGGLNSSEAQNIENNLDQYSVSTHCVLIWPKKLGGLIRKGYEINLDLKIEAIRDIVLNFSLCDLVPKNFESKKWNAIFAKLFHAAKDSKDATSLNQVYQDIAIYLVLFLYDENAPNNRNNTFLSFIENERLPIDKIYDQVLFINPNAWLSLMNWKFSQNKWNFIGTFHNKLYANIVRLYSNEIIGRFVGCEANESMNRLLGFSMTSILSFYKNAAPPKEQRLRIYIATANFFINHTYFSEFSREEVSRSKVYPSDGVNSLGYTRKNCFSRKVKREESNLNEMQVEEFLTQDWKKVNLDYAVVKLSVTFFQQEMAEFPEEEITKFISVFIMQFIEANKKLEFYDYDDDYYERESYNRRDFDDYGYGSD